MRTRELQERLKGLGYSVGPIDGIMGRQTIGAVKAFQRASGLVPDGIVGPKTLAVLLPPSQTATERVKTESDDLALPWFDEAMRLKGLREGAGSANNRTILNWADDLDLAYTGDDVPWCGLFVGHCVAAALPDEPLPGNPLGARNWLGFGRQCEPFVGAVLVFWRGSRSGWQGHVGFMAGEDASTFSVLGGNQGDAVTIARITKNRLLGARWPESAPFVRKSAAGVGGALSVNEA